MTDVLLGDLVFHHPSSSCVVYQKIGADCYGWLIVWLRNRLSLASGIAGN
jgi:hypothetical protein